MTHHQQHAVPWFGRLGLRLAALLAISMLLFDQLISPWLHQVVDQRIGLPEEIFVTSDEAGDLPSAEDEARHLIETLFDSDDPQLAPELADTESLSDILAARGEAFTWIGVDGRVMATSLDLPWRVGSEWNHKTTGHFDVVIDANEGMSAHVVPVLIAENDPDAGTFALLIFYPTGEFVPCHDHDGVVVMTESELDAAEARQETITRWLSAVIVVVVAGVVASFISLLITRRVRRLAATASARPAAPGVIPGPFMEEGADEIAALARSMNHMRTYATGLLDDLAQRDVSRREWIAQVSHDLRTPLTALLACLDRADQLMARPDLQIGELRQILGVARLDADRVQALADDLFEIARLEASDPLHLEEVPPGELVQQAVTMLQPMAQHNDMRLLAEVERGLPPLEADGRRLMRAMENLIRNAIQHGSKDITVAAHRTDDAVRFEVRDDGPGLPQSNGRVHLEDLGARNGSADSAGLGLVVASKVAEAHHGKIGAYNLESGGAAVWLTVPVADLTST